MRLWAVLQIRGAEGVRASVRRGIELARWAEAEIVRSPHWELVTPASLSVVTFAHRDGEDVTRAVAPLAMADGYAAVSATTVGGRPAVRVHDQPRHHGGRHIGHARPPGRAGGPDVTRPAGRRLTAPGTEREDGRRPEVPPVSSFLLEPG